MAILRGFPPSNTISPGVRITEKDLSFIAPDQSLHRAGLVGFASKGPINIPTVIRTTRQLYATFGFPHPDVSDPYLIYAATQYLMVANELFVVRVADDDAVSDERAKTAEVDVPAAGTKVIVTSETAGDYVFAEDSFFRWKLNGQLASKTLTVAAGTYTCTELVTDLNDQLVSLDPNGDELELAGVKFFVGDDDNLGISTTFSYGPEASLEFVSVQNSIFGAATTVTGITGLGTEMTQATIVSDNDQYPSDAGAGNWDLTGVDGLELEVVIDGTDNVNIDNVVQVIDLADLTASLSTVELTTEDIVTFINGLITDGTLPGGFYAVGGGVTDGPVIGSTTIDLTGHTYVDSDALVLQTIHSGRDARLLVKSTSSAAPIFDFPTVTAKGTTPSGVSGDADIETLGLVVGDTDPDVITFTVTADSPGIEGNATQVVIKNDIREASFTLEVYNNGTQLESWGNLSKDDASRFYVQTFIALVSEFVRVTDNADEPASPLDGTYDLAGGSDGVPSDPDDQDTMLIGNPIGFTGLYALSEPEQVDVDLMAVPGHASTAVIEALLEVCQDRGDCLAIVDPPFGLTVKEIVHWQNGQHPLNTTRFDSDFGAMYWPWVKIHDSHNAVDVWVPPSGNVMATIARSDTLSAPWFAPAGLTRGNVVGITDVFNRPTLEERDLMYGNRNCVNPIVQFSDSDGFVIWGQKTLQRRPTALDRVNVRRLMFNIEKRIRTASKSLLFEPNDEQFRNNFVNICSRILEDVKTGRGLHDFIIDAGDELNTADVIDRNEFRARIGIQPTKSVEFMFIEFSLHRTGDFGANSDTF